MSISDMVVVNDKFMSSEELNEEFKQEILQTLREGICEVTFIKVNGEARIMPCTLREDLLPAREQKSLTFDVLRERKGDAISVWCTDAQAWRSFKLSKLTGIKRL
jgi:hypothetical protein